MNDTLHTPREILNLLAAHNPQMMELATCLSLAVRIEPALLRKVRLTFLPKSEPGLEADLWFSPLVQSRSSSAIIFRPDMLEQLRQDLTDPQGQNYHRLEQARDIIKSMHQTAPEALRLEEEVTYLALAGRAEEIEERLQQAVATMAQTTRVGDLTRWAVRALPQLPEVARQTSAATVLALTASARLGNYRILDVLFPDEKAQSWLTELLPKDLSRVRVGVRLFANAVEFCDPDQEGALILEAPKTNPVLLEVTVNGNSTSHIQWIPKANPRVDRSNGPITIRTILGETYRLQPQLSSGEQRPPIQERPANAETATSISTIPLELFEIWVTALLNLSLSNEQYRERLLQGIPKELIATIPFQSAPRANLQGLIQTVAQWSQYRGETIPLLHLIDNTLALLPRNSESRNVLAAFRDELSPEETSLLSGTDLDLLTRYTHAIARISLPGASGTGFMITPNLLLTTNILVPNLAATRECKIQFESYTCSVAGHEGLVYCSPNLPFAIVRVNKDTITNEKQNFLTLTNDIPAIEPSSRVIIVYSSHVGGPYSVFPGEALQLDEDAQTLRYQVEVESGSAGAPILNQSGQLIAMHYARTPLYNQGIGLTVQAILNDIRINASWLLPVLELANHPDENVSEYKGVSEYLASENYFSLSDKISYIRNVELRRIIQQKQSNNDFDVFLSYNWLDRSLVEQIATQLLEQGILPWLDEWELKPGVSWQPLLEQQIKIIKVAAILIGKVGVSPWQQKEIDVFINESITRNAPIIPVLLPGTPDLPQLPTFIQDRTRVDFRKQDPNPMEYLLWGITGQRNRNTLSSMLQNKREIGDFDVFLCHNPVDKPLVRQIGIQLLEQGILPWLDEWELRPGVSWQHSLERQIKRIKTAAVFIGKSGIAPWQQEEVNAFLDEFIERSLPIIPVLLPDVPQKPKLPSFLQSMSWVDFRKQDPDTLERLVWGITGQRKLPSMIQSNHETDEFDVFMCYDEVDKSTVQKIGEQLIDRGIHPWLEDWELRPGVPRNQVLERQIERSKTIAIFIGGSGIGPWQEITISASLDEFANRGIAIIPVLLADAPKEPRVPVILRQFSWVDFRTSDSNPMERLIQGIKNTGDNASKDNRDQWWAADGRIPRLKEAIQNETVRTLLDLTATHATTWVSFEQVYREAGRSSDQARADLRGLSLLIKKLFQNNAGGWWPVEIKAGSPIQYQMSKEIALLWQRS